MEEVREYYAHTSGDGLEPLMDHLEKTGKLCSSFAADFGNEEIGMFLGRVHDIGKHTEKFQKVLKHQMQKIDHAIVSGIVIFNQDKMYPDLSIRRHLAGIAASHHASLTCDDGKFYEVEDYDDPVEMAGIDPTEDKTNALKNDTEYRELIRWAKEENCLYPVHVPGAFSPDKLTTKLQQMLYARMLFSCLVDADYSATASLDNPLYVTENTREIKDYDEMLLKLSNYHENLVKHSDIHKPINILRNKVYAESAEAGKKYGPGVYTLTAPTGTAKTLALIRFALEQAKRNGQKRIFIILPYLSIISQNADVYRRIFGEDAVLENDSQTDYTERTKELADRWSSPIIVTTAVAFFETMFASRSITLRKLHQISNAVIIYDECQTLPEHLLDSTLEAVSELPRYGSTVLFSTATLPVYTYRKNLTKSWHPIELISDYDRLFSLYEKAKNTDVIFDTHNEYNAADLFKYFEKDRQVLFVFNTVKKAEEMYDEAISHIGEGHCVLLTSFMCSQHKLDTIKDIKERIASGEKLYIISTQCIEAGVDIDVPTGCREFAPLSSIIQTAGRINRNGNGHGKFLVFMHAEHTQRDFPGTDYMNASKQSRSQADQNGINIYEASSIDKYYQGLYSTKGIDVDDGELLKAINKENYLDVHKNYQMIENRKQCNIIVPYQGCKEQFDTLYKKITEDRCIITKKDMRDARRFTVSISENKDLSTCCIQLNLRNYGEIEPTNWYLMTNASFYTKRGFERNKIEDTMFI